MEKQIKIVKDSGDVVDYQPEKFHKRTRYAVEGLDASASEIEMNAHMQIVDGVRSKDIQKALIKSAADGISVDSPDNEIAAARLLNQDIRKEVYGDYIPKKLIDMVTKNIESGYYDGEYLKKHYTRDELIKFGNVIDYNKDDTFVYSGLKKTVSDYLIKRNGFVQETPQEMFMIINIFAFAEYKNKYDTATRKKWIIKGYHLLSDYKVSLPTPIMIQLRTMYRKFISCNLINPGDNKETLANASKHIMQMVANGAGIGIGDDVRGRGASIDNGRLDHTGCLPIYKGYEKNSKSFVQPSRNGSMTHSYPFYHMEVNSMLTWGNNKGTEETRIRNMDHAILTNKLFFERYRDKQHITLFFLNDVPDIGSFLGEHEKFKELYEAYEISVPEERQIRVPASEIFDKFIDERFLQSREYIDFMENVQSQGMYKIPLKFGNLCQEIFQPTMPIRGISIKRNIKFDNQEARSTYYELRREAYYHQVDDTKVIEFKAALKPLYDFEYVDINADVDESKDYDYFDLDGTVNLSEIGVCIIAGINLGYCKTNEDLEDASEYLVRLLEELIDYMEYDSPEMEKAAKMRRPIGIGFSDVFHDLAIHNLDYSTPEARQFMSDKVELCTYQMTLTSIILAKDFGPCQLISDTKYHDGLFPIDTYNKNVDELLEVQSKKDWEKLRKLLLKYGMRHSSLTANAPFGSSSVVSNSTPGLEPPRKLATNKDGVIKLVPGIREYKDNYTLVWENFDNIAYFKFVAIFQKWMDQAISLNQYTNLIQYGGKVKKSRLVNEILIARYYGLKSVYYSVIKSNEQTDGEKKDKYEKESEDSNGGRVDDLITEDDVEQSCSSGGCNI